jgi:two-component system, chemotaxis family, protein-glutamate methylesterase/glutaminase
MSQGYRQAAGRSVDVLVVDDSAVARQALRAVIEQEPGYRVLLASDPFDAVDVMRRTAPAAIVLDVDMPRMDGLTFLRKLMRQHPMPVILCTDHPERGLAGLELGAIEVIAKPSWSDAGGMAAWGSKLREGLRAAVEAQARDEPRPGPEPKHDSGVILPRRPCGMRNGPSERVIAIGASTGGVQAIARLLADFPREAPGIVIVQHMREVFTTAFAARLDSDPKIALRVVEAGPNEPVLPGVALIVPGHAHGLIRRAGAGYRVELVEGPPVSRHRPSVDVLFRSAAQAGGPFAAGVVLTGMQDDGAQGLLEMREEGGWTIAQDEATSVVFGMPREAIRRGAARQVLALDRIADALMRWAAAAPA